MRPPFVCSIHINFERMRPPVEWSVRIRKPYYLFVKNHNIINFNDAILFSFFSDFITRIIHIPDYEYNYNEHAKKGGDIDSLLGGMLWNTLAFEQFFSLRFPSPSLYG